MCDGRNVRRPCAMRSTAQDDAMSAKIDAAAAEARARDAVAGDGDRHARRTVPAPCQRPLSRARSRAAGRPLSCH
jgi:hypothetical protein